MMLAFEAYENIKALSEGRVSGRISEWPALKPEAQKVLARIAALEAELAAERERRAVVEADKDRYLNLTAYHEMQYHKLQHESEDELAAVRAERDAAQAEVALWMRNANEIEQEYLRELTTAQDDSQRYKQIYDAAIAWQRAVNANDGPYDARTEAAENFAWNCFLEAIDAAMNAEKKESK